MHNEKSTVVHPLNPLTAKSLGGFDTWVLAGGGNRCWWQAGLLQRLTLEHGIAIPARLRATSAGAGIATALMAGRLDAARTACERLYAQQRHLFEWKATLRDLRLRFAHAHVLPDWISSYVNEETFTRLREGPTRLQVALTRPARHLGLAGSVIAGTLAYWLDKHVAHSVHPRLPRWLGLQQSMHHLHECQDAADMQRLIYGSCTASPFMPVKHWGRELALDGGYFDNAPIPEVTLTADSNRVLVFLTRYYPKLPSLFEWRGRTYFQPSQKIPVSTFDCTHKTEVRDAWHLGHTDTVRLFQEG